MELFKKKTFWSTPRAWIKGLLWVIKFFKEVPPTCSVLIQDLMSLSVFSHSDIRVPVSVFIPWRSEIWRGKVRIKGLDYVGKLTV